MISIVFMSFLELELFGGKDFLRLHLLRRWRKNLKFGVKYPFKGIVLSSCNHPHVVPESLLSTFQRMSELLFSMQWKRKVNFDSLNLCLFLTQIYWMTWNTVNGHMDQFYDTFTMCFLLFGARQYNHHPLSLENSSFWHTG